MGSYLRERFGTSYYAVGFNFNQGSFRALDVDVKPMAPKEFKVGPAPSDSLDMYLTLARISNYFLDLRNSTKTRAVSDWLEAPHATRSIGSGYSAANPENYDAQRWLTKEFDGLVFFDTTTSNHQVVVGNPR